MTEDVKCPKCGAEEWLGDGDGLPYICSVCGFEEDGPGGGLEPPHGVS